MLRSRANILASFFLITVLALLAWTLSSRSGAADNSFTEPVRTVAIVKATRTNISRTLQLTAELRAWQEIDIHAKVAGYLKNIPVDMGDTIKQGQILATLDLPEQRQDQAKADADYQVAKLDYDRIETVIKKQPGLLAQEEVDKARGTYEQAKAAFERTRILADYAVIKAPFDGVITKRSADPGSLVQAGTTSNTQALPLVHLAEMDKLRLDVPVPESNASLIKVGLPVDIHIRATGETVHSSVARLSDKIDPATRTMNVEVDIDNKDLHLKPGIYATATIASESKQNVIAAPVQAVATGDKPNVWIVNANNIIEERPVTLGVQMPDRIEIKDGIMEGDLLVYGNRNNISTGMKVVPKIVDMPGE